MEDRDCSVMCNEDKNKSSAPIESICISSDDHESDDDIMIVDSVETKQEIITIEDSPMPEKKPKIIVNKKKIKKKRKKNINGNRKKMKVLNFQNIRKKRRGNTGLVVEGFDASTLGKNEASKQWRCNNSDTDSTVNIKPNERIVTCPPTSNRGKINVTIHNDKNKLVSGNTLKTPPILHSGFVCAQQNSVNRPSFSNCLHVQNNIRPLLSENQVSFGTSHSMNIINPLGCSTSNSNFPFKAPMPKTISTRLRAISIDGSNVAMFHGKQSVFSCRGIKICIDFFLKRGHTQIKAFVPQHRRSKSALVKDQFILEELFKGKQFIVFTPSRIINGHLVSSYDDRFVLNYAVETDGIVVSNDNFRDLINESSQYREVIQNRLLMYAFADDLFMIPDDPLGKKGPTLDSFLKMPI